MKTIILGKKSKKINNNNNNNNNHYIVFPYTCNYSVENRSTKIKWNALCKRVTIELNLLM